MQNIGSVFVSNGVEYQERLRLKNNLSCAGHVMCQLTPALNITKIIQVGFNFYQHICCSQTQSSLEENTHVQQHA